MAVSGRSHCRRFLRSGFLIAVLLGSACRGQTADYLRDIKPLLQHKCYACHAAWKQQGGLRVDTASALIAGGDSGQIVVPGQPDESYLLDVLTGAAGFQMPPADEGSALTADELQLVRDWIQDGAAVPADEQPQQDPSTWWSYQPLQRPPLPTLADDSWCRTDVDRFVAAARQAVDLPPAPPAQKAAWLRRVTIDLTGLPPTRAELQAFLADESPAAWETVVDDLLNRPQYGERWGRHWMDVWRYSDWYGSRGINEIRYSQRHIWRWRDWIVQSLNQDKGYDRMVQEMLAADELASTDPEILPATGYLGRNWYKFDRDVWMFETVERTGEAFLGLTLRCCRCHDHKFDPVTQQEYYRFRAFFEPHDVRTDPVSALIGTEKDATLGQVLTDGIARVYDRQPDAPTYRFERGDARFPDKSQPLTPGVPAALAGELQIHPVSLPVAAWYPHLRPELQQSLHERADGLVAIAEAGLTARQESGDNVALGEAELKLARAEAESLRRRLAAEVARYQDQPPVDAAALADQAAAAERSADVLRAEVALLKAENDEARLAAQQQLATATQAADQKSADYTPLGPQYPQTSTGRRSALAQWITSPDNPRTARVAVNHIWARHFGQPLVATPENFGLNGRQPTHPELLDWLATELIRHNWQMKPLHRQLVLSATYRQASYSDAAAAGRQTDPENQRYWKMNSQRMEAEVVRDSVLYLAGQLDLARGGPEIPETEGQASHRRSLYFRSTPNESMPLLEVFDLADPNGCYRRKQSVVPHQSLALMNSGLLLDQSRLIAEQLAAEPDLITAAFETILCRTPTVAETQRCREFLAQHPDILQDGEQPKFSQGGSATRPPAADLLQHSRENLVHTLFLHNDFVTIR